MNIQIRRIEQKDYKNAQAFQCEYLDQESMPRFEHRVADNPDLYLVAVDGDELIGVCYGQPSRKNPAAIQLQGIAVNLDHTKGYARTGIGSRLIRAFENVVQRCGFQKIDLGSADDVKVERFYVKNGFQPIELVAKGPNHHEFERIEVDSFEQGNRLKDQLRSKYNPEEVIYIFEKTLD